MKKQYEKPMAEKVEFNYKETIVASDSFKRIKGGKDNNGCYSGNKNASTDCSPDYT